MNPTPTPSGVEHNVSDFTLNRFLHAADIVKSMKGQGLPEPFLVAVLDYVRNNRGIYELMVLWQEAEDPADRDETIADLQELLEDLEGRPARPVMKPYIAFDQLDEVGQRVLAYKRKLREIIDRHGGVTKVAELSGIPQPSLSRMLNSASMPRRTTLYRIANALQIPETEVAADFSW